MKTHLQQWPNPLPKFSTHPNKRSRARYWLALVRCQSRNLLLLPVISRFPYICARGGRMFLDECFASANRGYQQRHPSAQRCCAPISLHPGRKLPSAHMLSPKSKMPTRKPWSIKHAGDRDKNVNQHGKKKKTAKEKAAFVVVLLRAHNLMMWHH
jgi:hypothetical protein